MKSRWTADEERTRIHQLAHAIRDVNMRSRMEVKDEVSWRLVASLASASCGAPA